MSAISSSVLNMMWMASIASKTLGWSNEDGTIKPLFRQIKEDSLVYNDRFGLYTMFFIFYLDFVRICQFGNKTKLQQ